MAATPTCTIAVHPKPSARFRMNGDAVETVLSAIFKDLTCSAARVEVADSISNAFIVALASHAIRGSRAKFDSKDQHTEVDTTRLWDTTNGEIEFKPFTELLQSLIALGRTPSLIRHWSNQHKDKGTTCKLGTFVDLGSGSGKAVLAAALACSFSRVRGIEIASKRHKVAAERLRRLLAKFPDLADVVELTLGSCLEEPWARDADVVFANNLCFGRSLNVDIAACCQKLRPGAIVITTKPLDTKCLTLHTTRPCRMSWCDDAAVNVYLRNDSFSSISGSITVTAAAAPPIGAATGDTHDGILAD